MPREFDFEVGQTTFSVGCAEGSYTVDEEAIVFDRRLETLLAIPCHILEHNSCTGDLMSVNTTPTKENTDPSAIRMKSASP